MEGWLQCVVSPGQILGRIRGQGQDFHWRSVSFCDKGRNRSPEAIHRITKGMLQIRIEIVDQKGDLLLVRLPRRTLENGQHITVRGSLSAKRRR